MKDSTIVLNAKFLETDNFRKFSKELFGPIHTNTSNENEQLEKDLLRSKIILDIDGQRIECSNIKEFLESSSGKLTQDQQDYIMNVGHQGLFGGGSIVIPLTISAMKHNVALTDTRNIQNILTTDVPLCVQIKGNKVTFANSIDFALVSEDAQSKGRVMLSMVADIR